MVNRTTRQLNLISLDRRHRRTNKVGSTPTSDSKGQGFSRNEKGTLTLPDLQNLYTPHPYHPTFLSPSHIVFHTYNGKRTLYAGSGFPGASKGSD